MGEFSVSGGIACATVVQGTARVRAQAYGGVRAVAGAIEAPVLLLPSGDPLLRLLEGPLTDGRDG